MSGRAPSREQLLTLLARYTDEDRVRQIVNELGGVRPTPFRVPDTVLVILFASRSGSNYLGQLLSSSGWFNEIGESFRPSQLSKIRDRYGLKDMHDAAQWMIDHRGTPDAFGIKAGFRVLIAATELGFLSQVVDRAEFVLLRRRDRLAQAVSLFKSKLSGRTHTGQPDRRPITEGDYDSDAIAFELAAISEVETQFADLANQLGKAAPVVYYEDVCANPQAHVAEICAQLGLPMPDDYVPEIRVGILRDGLSDRWIERFRGERPDAVERLAATP
jgi:LPS sulfotransferase NodH